MIYSFQWHIFVSNGVNSGLVFLNDTIISLVFLPLILMLFPEHQPVIVSRDFWRWLTSPCLICSVIVMSSMYLCIRIPSSASILFTYTRKHRGPSHKPCGTAPFIFNHDDTSSPILHVAVSRVGSCATMK